MHQGKIRFDGFELDPTARVVTFHGAPVDLGQKAFDVLLCLLENRDRIVPKEELVERVWPDQFVEENNLSVQVSAVRKAFRKFSAETEYIVTIPRTGYRFVGAVVGTDGNPTAQLPAVGQTESADGGRPISRRFWITILTAGVAVAFVAALMLWIGYRNVPETNREVVRITTSGAVTNAALAPDGQQVIFSQSGPDGESLWLRHLANGSQREVVKADRVEYVGLAASPDGAYVYATVFPGSTSPPQLRRISVIDGATKVIDGITTGAAVSFSPDGRRIAYTQSRSSLKQTQLIIANSDGTGQTAVAAAVDSERAFPNFRANPVAWSPDGKTIACAVSFAPEGASILLYDVGTGRERILDGVRSDFIENLTWIDENEIVFTAMSLAPLRGRIWSVSVLDGSTRRLTSDLHHYGFVAAAKGTLIAVKKDFGSQVSVAEADLAAGRLSFRHLRRETENIANAAFAADGRILFTSAASGRNEIWRMQPDGSAAEQRTDGADVTFGMTVSPADGSIVFSSTEGGRHLLKIADADGRSVRRLTEGPNDVYPDFSRDGRFVVFQKGLTNETLTLHRLDLASGSVTELTATQSSKPNVSPSDDTVAYYFMDSEGRWKIGYLSHSDGALTGSSELSGTPFVQRMAWTPGGEAIAQFIPGADESVLALIDRRSGKETLLRGERIGTVNSLDWSPATGRLVFAHNDEKQDVVIIRD